MIQVMILDDHQLFAEALALMLTSSGPVTITSICTKANQLETALETTQPDIVFLDICLDDTDGITVCRNILKKDPSLKIIALSMHHDLQCVKLMKDAGAKGYVYKHMDTNQIMDALETVYSNGTYFYDLMGNLINFNTISSTITSDLNPKEKKILDAVLSGKTSRQIAENLGISLKTVEFYRSSLLVKYDAKNVVELINKVRHYC